MAIPDEDVASVRAGTDIVALIGEHTALKRVGRRFVGLCPFHGEKTPSFSVNAEEGLYYCFGCQASGDAISFLRATEGCDFVEAIERLAGRAGITIHNDNDDPRAAEDRAKRQQLYEVMTAAVNFYHERLISGKDAGPARQYLRSRGYDGDVVRQFHLGFAPNAYNELAGALKFSTAIKSAAGLVYSGSGSSPQDAFRERLIFPIFDSAGKPIALGGRYLPPELRRSTRDPGPKYRNSPESSIYQKRRTLYGLNWAKSDISHSGEVIVCEGYTDVIGFHQAGISRAVATCGTALTEDHFRVLARFAKRIILVFDADTAGENAAARLYEWERRHELELSVASLPDGSDPGSLASTNPEQLRNAVRDARPFLGFRVERAFANAELTTPEGRNRAAEAALAAVAEHPNDLVRDEYLRQIADRTRFATDQLRGRLDEERGAVLRGEREPAPTPSAVTTQDDERRPPPQRLSRPQNRSNRGVRAGREGLILAIHQPEDVAGRFDEVLFVDPVQRSAFHTLSQASQLHEAIEKAEPESAELLRQLAVSDVPDDLDIDGTLVELVRNAGEIALRELDADARLAGNETDGGGFAQANAQIRHVKEELELLRDPLVQVSVESPAIVAANRLLAWLKARDGEGSL